MSEDLIIQDHKEEFDNAIEFYKKELNTVRTNRANPEMIETVLIEAYGVKTPLNQLASISVPEARTMNVEPWDKTVLKDIEKTLSTMLQGLSISNDGNLVRVTIPILTEETRKEILKSTSQKTENAKVTIRQIRDKVKEDINEKEKSKDITEDDKYDLQKKLDEFTSDYTKQIDELRSKKEEEIMTI